MFAIEVNELIKKYGTFSALKGISFSINKGEFFGLLGPNGAGKTTLIRILTTLLKPTSGKAKMMGIEVGKNNTEVRKLIGVVPQAMTSDLDLTGLENMDIYARFYNMSKKDRKVRIDDLLERVGLRDRRNDLVATYSGGMRRRLEIVKGLVHKPAILILDEPTIGLDPQSRHVVWDLLTNLRKEDALTILLTTHYMEEAEFLCERIAIIDHGEIVAIDTLEGLKKVIPTKDIVEIVIKGTAGERLIEDIKSLPIVRSIIIADGRLRISVENGAQAIPLLLDKIETSGGTATSILLKQQSLEDVFIHFTGRPIREEEARKVSFLIGAGLPQKMGR